MIHIDVVCTACNRPELLLNTLESLNFYYRIEDFHSVTVHEDFPGCENLPTKRRFPTVRFIESKYRKGHMRSLDRLYQEVVTDFFFHIEEDWEFYDGGFIEQSIALMVMYPDCMTAWLRAHKDTNGHPFSHNGRFLQMSTEHDHWAGFTLNPGLRRDAHYDFCFEEKAYPNRGAMAEVAIGQHMKSKGLVAAILDSSRGFVRHTGDAHKTVDIESEI